MDAWARGKDAADQMPLPLPDHFREQENLWNEHVVNDLEGTYPRGLILGEFETLGKSSEATGNFHLGYKE